MSGTSETASSEQITASQTRSDTRSGILNSFLLLAILLIAAFVRFYALDASSLWNDEGTTWALLARSFPDIARNSAADIHPPGYYWLLKVWTSLLGTSAWAMRSLSALLGVLLVFIVYKIGVHLEACRRTVRLTALLAAIIAALNPFQIYYSQEARMYMLLSVLAAGLFWSLFVLVKREAAGQSTLAPLVWYAICGAAGLWTHYSFPVIIFAAGLAYIIHLMRRPTLELIGSAKNRWQSLLHFALANLAILLLFLPWLPTAVNRVLNWPKGGEWTSPLDGLAILLQTLITGSIRSAPELAWQWLVLAAMLPLIGLWALRGRFSGSALGLWLLSPILLMLGLGLISDAFLKFLLHFE